MARTRIHPDDAPDLQSDAEASTHAADTTSVHGIADTSALSTTSHVHAGADITSGTVADARIDAALARDSEVATAVSDHAAAANPHAVYLTQAEGDAAYEVTGAVAAHTGDTSDAHDASAVSFAPAGAIAATDVQAAIEEIDTEKSGTGHTHSTDFGEAGDIAASAFGDTVAAGATGEVADAGHRHAREADPVTAHAAAGDPHAGYRLESADHSHATTGLQAGTVAHTALTSVGIDDHHARDHAVNGSTHTGTLDDAQIPAGIARDAEVAAAYQPLDSDLTAIAALTTTAFGRGLLALADAAALGANHSHAGGLGLTTVEVSLGSAPTARLAGRFTIAGTGMTVGKAVLIQQASGPYTGKGARADEAEMDLVVVTGKVTSATVIECFWNSQSPVRGFIRFDYAISS